MKKNMRRKGFTLIELVMVIVLIGIIAVFIAPRMVDVTGTKAGAFRDKLRADIRYAQNLAMTQNRRYRVYVNTAPGPANGYAVMNDSNGNGTWGEAGEIALDPAGSSNFVVTLNTGDYAGITVSTPAGGFIEFDSLGRPTIGGGVVLLVTPGGRTVTISDQTGAVN
jgi:MSHA pilin protein MshC